MTVRGRELSRRMFVRRSVSPREQYIIWDSQSFWKCQNYCPGGSLSDTAKAPHATLIDLSTHVSLKKMHSFSQNVFGKRKKRKEKKTALFNSSFFAIRFLPAEYFRSCCFVFAVIFSPPPPPPPGWFPADHILRYLEYHLPQGQNTYSMGGGGVWVLFSSFHLF